ncbi:MAG: helix-turn-helix domain-containing protein [Proteobacteria bacterium]|nr:helix-turn-helix domain-containing protein [Pseudomonadota bacterium]
MQDLTIGDLARETGVKVPTIRFYEQIGLMPEAPRTPSNRRLYGEAERKRLSFIRHARDLGFEIDDIRSLLAIAQEPQASCHEADSIARKHLLAINSRIERLTALREELERMVRECGHGRICDCRVISVLADHDQCLHDQHA